MDYQNSVSIALNGQPVRPEQATQEMITVAERVIKIMVDSGHAHGFFGDTGNPFVTDQVNGLLHDFFQFAQTQTKADYTKVHEPIPLNSLHRLSDNLVE